MSTALAKNEILRFLSSSTPEVLCVRGKWGVGKTFSWKRFLKEASEAKAGIALDRYAYVSLFGINSVEELKYAIFEGTVKRNQVGQAASLDTLSSAVESAESIGRKNTRWLSLIPVIKNYYTSAIPAFFLTVRNQIVCIDDLERKGSKLEAADVLGLISFLKEERACKVVLLLNDEALKSADRQMFDEYLEKVVDISIRFDPSPAESAAIAISNSDEIGRRVVELCTKLGIANIRVIRKIEKNVRAVHPLLKDFQQEVFRQASSTLALFGWAIYQPHEAPSLEFLTTKKMRLTFGVEGETKPTPTEAAWNALLNSYEYLYTDDFDLALGDGTKRGYFDPALIKGLATALHEQHKAAKSSDSFHVAWRDYHDSFQNNQDEVLDKLYKSFMENFQNITPLNLSGTARLFKELGRASQATEIIQHYVSNRNEGKTFFDLDEYAFQGDVTDTEMREAFRARCAALEEKRDVANLLLNLKDHWDHETISILAAAPVDLYVQAFKSHTGEQLRAILDGVFKFDRIVNASEAMKKVSERGRQALKIIGKESPINARRVAKFGVTIDEPDAIDGQTEAHQAAPAPVQRPEADNGQ